ncbi:MAG: hypothetical protein WB771_04385 [Solirubrobacterales bacterium]
MPPPRPSSAKPRPGEEERFGPLYVRRMRKEDGRTLILYEEQGEDRDQGERAPLTDGATPT